MSGDAGTQGRKLPEVDDGLRRGTVGFAVVRIIQRDYREEFDQLREQVCEGTVVTHGTVFNWPPEKQQMIAAWCDRLSLGCEAVHVAARQRCLFPDDGPSQPKAIVWLDEKGNIANDKIEFKFGETQKEFLRRAKALHDQWKRIEQVTGTIAASDRVNAAHVEWLVRFQVGREPYTKIAASARRDRQAVTEAIKGLAELLGLILRTSAPGRPRATRGPLKNRPHRVSRTPRS